MKQRLSHFVIVDGGLAGVGATNAPRDARARVTLLGRTILTPGQVASPPREVLRNQSHTHMLAPGGTSTNETGTGQSASAGILALASFLGTASNP